MYYSWLPYFGSIDFYFFDELSNSSTSDSVLGQLPIQLFQYRTGTSPQVGFPMSPVVGDTLLY